MLRRLTERFVQVQLLLQRMKRHGFADCYLFHRMDLNGDGIITLGEFKQGLRLLHIKLSPKELNTFFAHFDRDKSGRIDYRELQVMLVPCVTGIKTIVV